MKAVTTFPLPEAAVALLSEVASVAGPGGWQRFNPEQRELPLVLEIRQSAAAGSNRFIEPRTFRRWIV